MGRCGSSCTCNFWLFRKTSLVFISLQSCFPKIYNSNSFSSLPVVLTVNLKKTTCTKELISSNLKGLTYHDKYLVFQTQPLLIYKLILLHLAFAVCSNPKHPSLDILLFVMGFTCPFAIYLFCTVALAAWSLIFADGNSYFDTVGQQFHFISQ